MGFVRSCLLNRQRVDATNRLLPVLLAAGARTRIPSRSSAVGLGAAFLSSAVGLGAGFFSSVVGLSQTDSNFMPSLCTTASSSENLHIEIILMDDLNEK